MALERNFRAYGGLTWFPYQLAFGLSLRYDAGLWAVRLYLGPLKVWGTIEAADRA